MKRIRHCILLLALICLAAGCRKEYSPGETASSSAGLVVSASIQGEGSKVSLSVQSSCLKAEWELDDRITVFDAQGNTYGYKVVSIHDGLATMQLIPPGEEGGGNTEGTPSEATVLYAVYCPGYAPDDIKSGVLSVDLSMQNGDAGQYALMLSRATVASGNVLFNFQNSMSILGVRNPVLSGLSEGLMTGLSVAGPQICNRVEISIADSQLQLVPAGYGSINVCLEEPLAVLDGNTPEGTEIFAAVPPFKEASGLYFTAILSDKSILFRHYKQDKLFVASKYYRTSPKFSREDGLGGQFSVSETRKVFFSGGNLWCDASVTPAVWAFEDEQLFIPYYNIHEGIKNVYDPTHVRHFFWSYDHSYGSSEYYEGTSFPSADQLVDWGGEYCESSGYDGWITLSEQEWNYLLSVRGSDSTFFRTGVSIADNSDQYLVIAPDGNTEGIKAEYNLLEWREAERNGFVCLAPAGYRSEANYPDVPCMFRMGINGFYWTSDACEGLGDRARARAVTFGESPYAFSLHGRYVRSQAFSVRLVCE